MHNSDQTAFKRPACVEVAYLGQLNLLGAGSLTHFTGVGSGQRVGDHNSMEMCKSLGRHAICDHVKRVLRRSASGSVYRPGFCLETRVNWTAKNHGPDPPLGVPGDRTTGGGVGGQTPTREVGEFDQKLVPPKNEGDWDPL
eukprot:EG_transcript_38713